MIAVEGFADQGKAGMRVFSAQVVPKLPCERRTVVTPAAD